MSYSVSQVQTPQLAEYESWDVVWFFHLNTFPDEVITSTRRLQQQNHDWEAIADEALACGVSAVCTHAIDQAGYQYFDSGRSIPPHRMDSTSFPRYSATQYKITSDVSRGLGITPDHLYRFHKAFTSRGIKVGVYFITGQSLNLFDSILFSTNDSSKAVWTEFLIGEFKYLNELFNWDFVWWDFPAFADFTDAQLDSIYQAIRAKNGSLVIMNDIQDGPPVPPGGTGFRFPCDVKHIETDHTPPLNGESWFSPTTNVNGTDYYIPSGLAYSGIYSETVPGGVKTTMWQARLWAGDPGLTENLTRDQVDFNTWYTYARSRNVPFFMNMPTRYGALDPTYLNRAQNLAIIP